jgi:hypothetical protein
LLSGTGNLIAWQRSRLQKTIIFVVNVAPKWGLVSEFLLLQHCWWRLENLNSLSVRRTFILYSKSMYQIHCFHEFMWEVLS